MSTDVRRDAEELARYYAELGRRLAQTGVRDVQDLVALYEQLRRAVAAISPQEIAWAAEQVQALLERVVRLEANLAALRRLKEELAHLPDSGGRPGSAAR